MKTDAAVPQKAENRSTSRSAIPFLSIYPKYSISYFIDTCSTIFIDILFTIDRNWKQPRYTSTDR